MISSLTYITMNRVINDNIQQNIATEHVIELHEDKIITAKHRLLVKSVLDISYKSTSTQSGVLYLHTNQGVFSFNIKSNPTYFISEYQKLRRKI